MATAQAAVVVVVAAGCSGAGVAAGSGVVAASSGASPPSPKSSDLLYPGSWEPMLALLWLPALLYTQHLLIESTPQLTCENLS